MPPYLWLAIHIFRDMCHVNFMTETATHCRHVAKLMLSLNLVENIERLLENKVDKRYFCCFDYMPGKKKGQELAVMECEHSRPE